MRPRCALCGDTGRLDARSDSKKKVFCACILGVRARHQDDGARKGGNASAKKLRESKQDGYSVEYEDGLKKE